MVLKREYYEKTKSMGKCVNCGKERDTKRSKCLCLSCLEKNGHKTRFYQKQKRNAFKELGVCRHCGGQLAEGSTYYCKICIDYNRRKGRQYVNSVKGKSRRRLHHHITKFKALQKVSGERVPICARCGIKDVRILTINHNDGKQAIDMKHRNKKRLTYKTIYGLINSGKRETKDLSVLCYNCNILYEHERKRIGLDIQSLENELKAKNVIMGSDSIGGGISGSEKRGYERIGSIRNRRGIGKNLDGTVRPCREKIIHCDGCNA